MLRGIFFLLAVQCLQRRALAANTTSSQVLWSNHTLPYNASATQNSSLPQITPCQVGQNLNWDPDSRMGAQLSPQVGNVDSIGSYGEYCALWNSSCSGDFDTAFRNFENNVAWVDDGKFYDCGNSQMVNAAALPENSRGLVTQMISYAQSPQCTSMYRDINCPGFSMSSQSQCLAKSFPAAPCCGACWFAGIVVDLLYWPSEDADTSCLSIIGNSVNPVDKDAITSSWIDPSDNKPTSLVVWGCTTMSTASNGSIVYGFENTAAQTTIGTLTFKSDFVNPWDNHVTCVQSSGEITASQHSRISAAPLHVQAHSLVNITRKINNMTQPLTRVAVSDGYT